MYEIHLQTEELVHTCDVTSAILFNKSLQLQESAKRLWHEPFKLCHNCSTFFVKVPSLLLEVV